MNLWTLGSNARSALLLLLLAATWPMAASADLLLISRTSHDGAPPTAAYAWVGDQHFRFDDGQQAMIADLRSGTMTVLNHAARTAQSFTIPSTPVGSPIQPQLIGPGKVRQWPSNRYLLSWPELGISSIVDVTQPNEISLDNYQRALRTLSRVPGAGWMAALAQLPGLPVRIESSDTSAAGEPRTSLRETLNLFERNPPVAIYRVPTNYRQAPQGE